MQIDRLDVTSLLLPVQVGGYPEPDGTQPMSPAEFRMVREHLGLTGDALGEMLGVSNRMVRKWEAGAAPVSRGVREDMERVEQVFVSMAAEVAERLRDAADVVLTIPAGDAGGFPGGWWRALAYEVSVLVPGVHVRYADG